MFYPRSNYHCPKLVSAQLNTLEVPACFYDVVLPFVVPMKVRNLCIVVKGAISRLRVTNVRR
jgi:hypothetical protein